MKKFLRSVFSVLTIVIVSTQLIQAQAPVANFTVNTNKGCGFAIVNFTDISTNSPTSWLWTFGDGGATSNERNPANVYSSPGDYTVTLTATNANGSDSETKVAYIHVYEKPKVGFSASLNNACTPASITFTDNSVTAAAITNYEWDFGDGSGSANVAPTHVFNTALNYEVSLSITDANDCFNTKSIPNFIKVDDTPTAAFTVNATESCTSPFTAIFNSGTSVGTITEYLWDFGDGTTSTDANPSHTYASDGDYSVSLTVTTAAGCSNTLNNIDYIHVNSFKADFTNTPTDICMGQAVVFNNTSNQPSASQTWAFGDGNTSSALAPSKIYATAGTFDVTLTAVSAGGCSNAKTTSVTVHAKPDVQILANDSVSCTAPFSVDFTSPTPDLNAWTWDFGDGNTSAVATPTNNYIAEGLYSVELTATDIYGCFNTTTKTDYIVVRKPVVDFNSDVTGGCLPVTVNFSDISTADNTITTWSWDFGDGNTSTDQNPTHIYGGNIDVDTGKYDVTLFIEDIKGCSNTLLMTKYIGVGRNPNADFDLEDDTICFSDTAMFISKAADYTNEFLWDFMYDSGSTSAGEDTTYQQYADTGTYSVMYVAGHYECYDTIIKVDTITILPPISRFLPDKNIICNFPETVIFGDSTIQAKTYQWVFDDGDTLFVEEILPSRYRWVKNTTDTISHDTLATSPTHEYLSSGGYNIELVVGNAGCVDTSTYYVGVSSFDLGWIESKLESCEKRPVIYDDTTHSEFTLVDWMWDFGDGTPRVSADTMPTHIFTTSGTYDVELIVTDSLGCMDSLTRNANIIVNALPTPIFATVGDTTGCTHFDVDFADASTAAGGASITDWAWDFGDSNTSADQNPSHTYITRGQYDVSLRVTDSKGCDTILTRSNYIVPLKPFPSFTTSAIACHYDSIKFVNTSTGSKLDYSWDFGDTQTFLDTTPTHKYYVTQDTIVNVILTATEQDIVGCDSVFSLPISIKRPWAKFDADETYADCPPFTPVFTENSGLALSKFMWNFGDVLSKVNNTTVLQNPQHIYKHPGTFDVRLIVEDADNCVDTLLREDYIVLGGPTGSFTFTPDIVCSPGEVTFVADTQNTVRVDWIFDDGTKEENSGTTTTHTYIVGQTYTPAISLYDANNCQYTPDPIESITVYEVNADFESDIEISCMDTVIQFTDLSTASHIIDSWEWRFGDDSISTLQNPSHDYSLGVYDVTLIVNSSICQFNSAKSEFITISEMPRPSFIVDSMVFIHEDVLLNNTSDSITSPIFYEWQIDGSLLTDTIESPVHKFDKRGTYEISLAQQTIPECVAFAFANVIVGDIVPNAFTPDNDGVNDVYLKDMGYDFIIINRWGQQMYEGYAGWDGTYKGEEVASGTYFYIITLSNGEELKGPVTLIRNK